MAGLTIKHLYKRYDNKGKKKKGAKPNDYAVKDLNLVDEQGEFIAFLGPWMVKHVRQCVQRSNV